MSVDEVGMDRFVLRWDGDEGWGHVAVDRGCGKPVFVGFVRVDDPVVRRAIVRRSVWVDGMWEAWLSDARRRLGGA